MNPGQRAHHASDLAASRDAQLFRFTVKCDRDQNRLIERRARACGVSPTTLVQRHFETLFEAGAAPAAAPVAPMPEPDTKAPAGPGLAPLSPADSVLLACLRASADAQGRVSRAYDDLAFETGLSRSSVSNGMTRLMRAGFIERLTFGTRVEPARFRIPCEARP